jgi:hypothetical protein
MNIQNIKYKLSELLLKLACFITNHEWVPSRYRALNSNGISYQCAKCKTWRYVE